MPGLLGRSLDPREAIGKDLALARRLVAGERLEYDVIALLRKGRAIPGPMECDEYAVMVAGGKLRLVVERHAIGRPVRRKIHDGPGFFRAFADLLAIPAIFGREHQAMQPGVVIALGP